VSEATETADAVEVLDKGFVRLVGLLGGDVAVVQSARVSYGQGSKGEERDRKLLAFLLKHKHMTPFEHSVFTWHVKTPIFVMRQWIRHRAGAFNEVSARYTEVQDEFYLPETFRAPDAKNKQSSQSAPALDQGRCREVLERSQRAAYEAYQELLKAGAARELSRLALPVSQYTQFYWTVSARNLMHFINLRADAPAQWEIQRYAEALTAFFARKLPWTWAAFLENGWTGKNARLDEEKRSLCPPASS